MDEGFNIIFGWAITASSIEAYQTGYSSLVEEICNSFAVAQGIGEEGGANIFFQIKNGKSIKTTSGFGGGSLFLEYQRNIKSSLLAQYPEINDINADIYSIVVNSIIFGYTFCTNVQLQTVSDFIGHVFQEVNTRITNTNPFPFNIKTGLIHPFTPDFIKSFLLTADYSMVYAQIQSSPKDTDCNLVNYNWYDTTDIFSGPNLQKMKDCENQYYYVSGQLLYPDVPQDFPECIEETYIIQTPFGNKIATRLTNYPCYNNDGYIGPNTTDFYRIFNDGPYSSGDFTSIVKEEFIQFDKNILSGYQYGTNATGLFSYFRGSDGNFGRLLLNRETQIDSYGAIDLEQEYTNIPASYECYPVYQTMRVGGASIRPFCSYDQFGNCYDCNTGLFTGLKYVPLQVNLDKFPNRFSKIKTNPQISTQSMVSRSLNFEDSPYLGTPQNGTINTFILSFNGDENWYSGPPQLKGGDTLPYLAFYQDFDSNTFNKFATITLFTAIGEANGSPSRDFTINLEPISSGIDENHYMIDNSSGNFPKAKFNTTIDSSGEFEETKNKVFSIGDGFNNQYNIIAYPAENAGYQYSGFYVSGSAGLKYSSIQRLLQDYSDFIIGSQYKNVSYISGYTGDNLLSITKMFCQNESGDERFEYYYFDNRLNDVNIPQTGWDSFAPLPDIDNSGNYGRVYTQQYNENYFPRFYRGPYAALDKKFLYPNASGATSQYPNNLGFPMRVKFKLRVREQAIKELYSRYLISNGTFSNVPEFVNVIRPHNQGFNLGVINELFDGAGNPLLDFNLWKSDDYGFSNTISTNLVDNLWTPVFETYFNGDVNVPAWSSGRNGVIYSDNPTFIQGILLTGKDNLSTKIYTGNGQFKIIDTHKSAGVGLYNYYTGKTITGFLTYANPVFSLESGIIDATSAINAIPIVGLDSCDGGLVNANVNYFLGKKFIAQEGQDPIYLEYINGRSGQFSKEEGSYHSKNIIGDSWMYFTGEQYGYTTCNSFTNQCNRQRQPEEDVFLFLINSTNNSTTIHTRAANFTPFILNYKKPYNFISGDLITNNKSISFKYGQDCVYFDLGSVFPIKTRTGQAYGQSLILGPFDRDVEITSKSQITGYTTIYFNNKIMADYYGCIGNYDCDYRGNILGASLLKVVPSGETLKIDIGSNFDCQFTGNIDPAFLTGIGVNSQSYLYIKAKGTILESNPISTDEDYWNNFLFDQNGIESQYTINHNGGFENLQGINEFDVFTRTGILYPQPEINDFNNYKTTGQFGNGIYPTVQQFWKNFTKTGSIVYASGWREGSRISFDFEDIEITYDDFPYSSHKIVIPSGSCVLTGEMGYYGQADNCIFSEGIHLVDNTPDNSTTGLYAPTFYSPVLNRLPMFNQPLGLVNQLVQDAPSKMIQRVNPLIITANQDYIKLNNQGPENYNKFFWPSLSDLKILNPDETIEAIPPDDGNTFLNSQILISASQGQKLADGTKNPNAKKVYNVHQQWQTYDSVATDAIINSGKFITNKRGTVVRLEQPISGVLAPEGSTISNILKGLI